MQACGVVWENQMDQRRTPCARDRFLPSIVVLGWRACFSRAHKLRRMLCLCRSACTTALVSRRPLRASSEAPCTIAWVFTVQNAANVRAGVLQRPWIRRLSLITLDHRPPGLASAIAAFPSQPVAGVTARRLQTIGHWITTLRCLHE